MIARLTLLAGAAGIALAAPGAARAEDDEPWTLHEAIGAPDNLRISGSLRARYEILSNQFRPGLDENDDLIELRTTLFAEYDAGPVRFGAELIDARAYDADAGSSVGTGEVNALELAQAYIGADLGDALGEGTSTTVDVGRFLLDLGSRRLVGRNNFGNTTAAFTGARGEWRGRGRERLTLFYTLPQQKLPSDKDSILDDEVEWDHEGWDQQFWGAFLTVPNVAWNAGLDLYLFGLEEDDRDSVATRDRHIFTPGIRLFRDPAAGKWDFELELMYQFGNIRTSTAPTAARQDVSAFSTHLELGYQFAGSWKPRLQAEFDLATGDRPGGDYARFDQLFGPRRPDWGPGGIYGPFGRANIISPGVRLEVTPSDRWDGFVGYRAAWLEAREDSFASTGVRDPAGSAGRFAGHQVEARARYWIVPGLLRLDSGAAMLFSGRFLDEAANANRFGNTVYAYTDLTLTF
ncbi:MAG TPA: alginate export family protein [Allosphingosinicella sp.]|jgi:hypothetical protein